MQLYLFMCTNPILIKNKGTYFGPGSPVHILVPCGHCPECIAQRQQEWAARCVAEYKDCYWVYFETLTYANEFLPIIQLPDGSTETGFNTHHLALFFKRLRRTLEIKGYDMYDIDEHGKKVSRLRYFVCAERGKHGDRPHYHVLFFNHVPKLKVWDLYHAIRGLSKDKFEWRDKAGRLHHGRPAAWPYGFNNKFCMISRMLVNSPAAATYVSKYVAKDFQRADEIRNSHPEIDDTTWKEVSKPLSGFHHQSLGFGLSLLDNFDEKEFIEQGSIRVVADSGQLDKHIPLPNYLLGKLYKRIIYSPYTSNETRSIYTSKGLEMLLDRLQYKIKRQADKFRYLMQNQKAWLEPNEIDLVPKLDESQLFELAAYDVVYKETYNPDHIPLCECDLYDWYIKRFDMPFSLDDSLPFNSMRSSSYYARREAELEYLGSSHFDPLYEFYLERFNILTKRRNKCKLKYDLDKTRKKRILQNHKL